MTDEPSGLAAALSAAQGEFGIVPKGGYNPHFKSHFPELADAVRTAAPALSRHGLAVSQLVGFDDESEILTTILMHASGEQLQTVMRLRPVKNDPQSQGSAITYARRYAYMAILGLAADEDDDGEKASEPTAGEGFRPGFSTPAAAPTEPGDGQPRNLDQARQQLLDICKGDEAKFAKSWPGFARSRGLEP